MSEKHELNVPDIQWDTVLFGWQEYELIALSEEWVQQTWTPIEIAKSWLLAIEWNKIWHFWIPDKYLPFVLINEILCPNVLDQEGLCLQVLQNAEIWEAVWKNGNIYINWRIDFFKWMEKYWLEIWNNNKYAQEMKKCYEWLESELNRREAIADALFWISKII